MSLAVLSELAHMASAAYLQYKIPKPQTPAQEALEAHQRLFVWDETGDGGIYTLVEKELALRAQTLGDVRSII